MRILTPKALAAVAALSISSTAAYAAPAAPIDRTAPVKMSDHQLDGVSAGTVAPRPASRTTRIVCSFGNNCSGNGGSNNGNSAGFVNALNGTLAGSSIASGNSVSVSVSVNAR